MGMINGRPYIVKYAKEVETGEHIWVQNPDWQLWPIERIETSGLFLLFIGPKGSVMHERMSGVYVDIKRGK